MRGFYGSEICICRILGSYCEQFNSLQILVSRLQVPVGTLFRRPSEETISADLKRPGDIFLAARGGAGGRGNQFFVCNENRAPLCAEFGGLGELKQYDVELRVMAHAGLVGFPNAGKSTLLRAISRARPKVACYPFTTMNPMVGTIEYDDYEQLSVADIPGLLPGVEDNYGVGTSFLKHIERCLCLFYVIDLSIGEPWLQLYELQTQLDSYKPGLSKRPYAIVGNKIDLEMSRKNLAEFNARTDLRIISISAKNRLNLDELLIYFRQLYDKHKLEWQNE
uniref:Mitochondrial ribosome-associated GTPase 2 n=1 Tax=Romanomermis culicivorax TaxID=13658 RepID=A0A915JWA6_ROMCU